MESAEGQERPYDVENLVHRGKLTLFCRLCKRQNLHLNRGKPIPAIRYQREIKKQHALDISKDDIYIHPQSICDICRRRLDRFKIADSSRKQISTNFVPVLFLPHCNDCEICQSSIENLDMKTPGMPEENQTPPSTSSTKRKNEFEIEQQPKVTILKLESLLSFNIDPDPLSSNGQCIKDDRFVEAEVAGRLCCQVCGCVPMKPSVSSCGHIYCQSCIHLRQKHKNTCVTCGKVIEAIVGLPFAGSVFNVLHVKCKYAKKGCQETPLCQELENHETNCKFGKYSQAILAQPSMFKRGPGIKKIPLHEANRKYVRSRRLKSLLEFVTSFCEQHFESKIDVLYYMLYNELLLMNENVKSNAVFNIWQSKDTTAGVILSPEECLALKVETLQNKTQYKMQYDFFSQRKDLRFCPPNALNTAEKKFMPNSTTFEILGQELGEQTKFKYCGDVEPMNILESFNIGVQERHAPKCRGVRWYYVNAIAKTLEELDSEISPNMEKIKADNNEFEPEKLVLKTYIKDKVNGKVGDSKCKVKGDQHQNPANPMKALRFTFCVLECVAFVRGKKHVLYKEENPYSMRRNRPLLEVLGNVNNPSSVSAAISPLEKEREHLKGKIIKVFIGETDRYRKHELNFISSVEDVEYYMAQEQLENESGPSSIGELCIDGNEEYFQKNLSILRDYSLPGLVGALKQLWLYTSPKLQHLINVSYRKNRCSNCKQEGHTRLTCPNQKEETKTENVDSDDDPEVSDGDSQMM